MEIIPLPSRFDFGYLLKIVSILKEGGTVVSPTDTVYGLLGDAQNRQTVEKILLLKGRSAVKAMPVLVSSYKMLEEAAYVKDERVMEFLKKVWPGKATCVLPARGWLSLELRGGELSVGVRMPDHSFLLKLIESFGGPLIGTSANLSGRGPYSKAEDIISEFKKMPFAPDLVIDAGGLPDSSVSTVVALTEWPPKILRQGAVSNEKIMSYIGL